jgi:tetratricopeptide (TPR) repeat protein
MMKQLIRLINFFRQFSWRQSESMWIEMLKKDPNNGAASAALAYHYWSHQEYENCNKYSMRALERFDDDREMLLLAAASAFRTGDHLAALGFARRALVASPSIDTAAIADSAAIRLLSQFKPIHKQVAALQAEVRSGASEVAELLAWAKDFVDHCHKNNPQGSL